MPQNNESAKIKMAFSADKTGDSSNNKSSSYDPGYHSSSTSSKSGSSQDWKNSPHLNNEFAQHHMSFLASILVSYEGLIAVDDNRCIIRDDEGYDWSAYDNEDGEVKAMVAKIMKSREEIESQSYLDMDPDEVNFEALVAIIPTVDVWCRGLREIRNYREKVKEEIYKVMNASLEKKKKKTVEEIVVESENLVKEVMKEKAGEEKSEEVVEEKQEKVEEDQKAEKTTVSSAEVNIQSESSKMLDKSVLKTDEQYKKCMEMCKACTEKDNSLRFRNIEFIKIEKIFKDKCNDMIENEKFLKQENEKLKQKCDDFEKENNILKEQYSEVCNECVPKDKTIQDLQKEYDVMKLSYHTVKEAYEVLKSKVTSLDNRLSACQETNSFLEARYKGKQLVVNNYIDEVTKLKQELAEKEKLVNKLQSYHASSYILERIFNITPDGKDSEKNKKGIGSEYHQVPPSLEDNYTFYDGEKVEKQ
ncbi:interaptin-like [Helianthus annuus]|uniref:interaptin-like n=1 Tax=Helianthus annuus TaxID=4232 RepID=UPI000B8F0020|nr:interaptin-like [Helianthus annuus]